MKNLLFIRLCSKADLDKRDFDSYRWVDQYVLSTVLLLKASIS